MTYLARLNYYGLVYICGKGGCRWSVLLLFRWSWKSRSRMLAHGTHILRSRARSVTRRDPKADVNTDAIPGSTPVLSLNPAKYTISQVLRRPCAAGGKACRAHSSRPCSTRVQHRALHGDIAKPTERRPERRRMNLPRFGCNLLSHSGSAPLCAPMRQP
jgi:hypothetical protein